MSHLLVTNDFPPKVGGIQSYLYELWRRLPPDRVTVLTSSYKGDQLFDAQQAFRVERDKWWLLPTSRLLRRIERIADEVDADLIVLDPALPVGLLGPRLSRPYAVVLHGAEIAVPSRIPVLKSLLARVVANAAHVISAGPYPESQARRLVGNRMPPSTVIAPGVDVDRFAPLTPEQRAESRRAFGLDVDAPTVVSISRLVPRKGMDVLIRAAALLSPSHPGLQVVIAGRGRDQRRLERLAARLDVPVRFLGSVDDSRLASVFGLGDVFAMICRSRWAGLEQEGFGIVFLEAAGCEVPQVAGRSGGAADAVSDGTTGIVVRDPKNPRAVATAIGELLDDASKRQEYGIHGRRRAEADYSYDALAGELDRVLITLEKAAN